MPTNRLTTAQRQLAGRAGAYESWSRTPDPAARTAPARRAMDEKFEREVDPHGELSLTERFKASGQCALVPSARSGTAHYALGRS